MKPSRASAVFAALLALTLAAKFVAVAEPAPADPGLFALTAAQMLADGGFQTEVWQRPMGPVLLGRRGDCRVLVAEYSPYGTFAPVLARFAAPIGPLHYLWRGQTYDRAPKVAPLMLFYLQRELRRIGIGVARSPIVAVGASPGCALDGVDWGRLESLPR